MPTTYTDNFMRGGGETTPFALENHTPTSGGSWSKIYSAGGGGMVVSPSGYVRENSATGAAANYVTSFLPPSHAYTVECDVQVIDNTSIIFPGSHMVSNGAGYFLYYYSGTFTLARYTNGTTATNMATLAMTVTGGTTIHLKIVTAISGSNVLISGYVGTTQIGSTFTDTSPLAVGQAGLACSVGAGSDTTGQLLTNFSETFPIAVILPNDSNLLYSPYNWLTASGSAKTINAGAYLRTIFSGTSAVLTTNTAANSAPYPQLWARIDNGAWTQYTLSAGNPSLTLATGLANRKHLLEIVVKSLSYTLDRWNTQAAGLTLTGLLLDDGGSLTAVRRKQYSILLYGDSITEGYGTPGNADPVETNNADALQGYAYALSQLLPAEVGVVGFDGSGISVGGQGNVPALPTSYNALWSGQARSFTPSPDFILYNEGTNDGTTNIVSAYTGVVNALRALAPAAKHLLLRPFNGNEAANVSATVAAVNSPLVTYLDTTGFWNSADSADSLHPYGYSSVGLIAPRVAAAVTNLLGSGLSLSSVIDGTLTLQQTLEILLAVAAGKRTDGGLVTSAHTEDVKYYKQDGATVAADATVTYAADNKTTTGRTVVLTP